MNADAFEIDSDFFEIIMCIFVHAVSYFDRKLTSKIKKKEMIMINNILITRLSISHIHCTCEL